MPRRQAEVAVAVSARGSRSPRRARPRTSSPRSTSTVDEPVAEADRGRRKRSEELLEPLSDTEALPRLPSRTRSCRPRSRPQAARHRTTRAADEIPSSAKPRTGTVDPAAETEQLSPRPRKMRLTPTPRCRNPRRKSRLSSRRILPSRRNLPPPKRSRSTPMRASRSNREWRRPAEEVDRARRQCSRGASFRGSRSSRSQPTAR